LSPPPGTSLAEASQSSLGTSQAGRRLQQQGSGRSYTSSYESASGGDQQQCLISAFCAVLQGVAVL